MGNQGTSSKRGVIDLLSDRPIAYHPLLAKAVGGVVEAVFLSQLLYWTDKGKLADGWIYKKSEDWSDETGLTRRNLETARRNLKDLGVLEEKVKGVPGTLHYRINLDVLADLLSLHASDNVQTVQSSLHGSDNLDCANQPNNNAQTAQSISETTTEITEDKDGFSPSSISPLSGVPIAADNHQRQVDLASGAPDPPEDPVDAVARHYYQGFMGCPVTLPDGKRERKKWQEAARRILKSLGTDWSMHDILFGIDDWWARDGLDAFWKDKPCKDETLDLVIRHCAAATRARAQDEAPPDQGPEPAPPNEAEVLWSKCMVLLKLQGRASGLEGSRGLARENGSLRVACSRLQKEWAEQRLASVMDGIIGQVAPGVKIVYEVTP